jgi:hypothetical protein
MCEKITATATGASGVGEPSQQRIKDSLALATGQRVGFEDVQYLQAFEGEKRDHRELGMAGRCANAFDNAPLMNTHRFEQIRVFSERDENTACRGPAVKLTAMGLDERGRNSVSLVGARLG